MAWKIEIAKSAEKELSKLDKPIQERILRYLKDRVEVEPREERFDERIVISYFWAGVSNYLIGAQNR